MRPQNFGTIRVEGRRGGASTGVQSGIDKKVHYDVGLFFDLGLTKVVMGEELVWLVKNLSPALLFCLFAGN